MTFLDDDDDDDDDDMGIDGAVADAAEAFEAFHGAEAEILTSIDDFPTIFFRVGKCVGIVYEVIENGKIVRYQHDFDAKPLLAVSDDGTTAAILSGDWLFTDRGFEG